MGSEKHLNARASTCDDSDAFFASYIAEMLSDLEVAFRAVQDEVHDIGAWKNLRIIAHKLKGSAPLYGYETLGEKASVAEIAILKDTDQARVLSYAEAFLTALRETHEEACLPVNTEVHEAELIQLPTALEGGTLANPSAALLEVQVTAKPEVRVQTQRKAKILTAFQSEWMVGYLTRHFEDTAELTNLNNSQDIAAWASSNQVDLYVFEHTEAGIDGFNLAKETVLRNPLKNASCLLGFYPGTSGRSVAEAVSLGAHTVIVDQNNPRLLAERIEGLMSVKQRRILLVDDDAPVQKILVDVFAGAGIQLDAATDGIEALDYLVTHRPDLILLDSIMPRLNGEATLHEIQSRADMHDIPVIVLTAETRTGSASRWFKRGAVDFITKPFDPEEVVARTLRYLEVNT